MGGGRPSHCDWYSWRGRGLASGPRGGVRLFREVHWGQWMTVNEVYEGSRRRWQRVPPLPDDQDEDEDDNDDDDDGWPWSYYTLFCENPFRGMAESQASVKALGSVSPFFLQTLLSPSLTSSSSTMETTGDLTSLCKFPVESLKCYIPIRQSWSRDQLPWKTLVPPWLSEWHPISYCHLGRQNGIRYRIATLAVRMASDIVTTWHKSTPVRQLVLQLQSIY